VSRKDGPFLDFPIKRDYKYLGVSIKDNSNIDITLNSIKDKSLLLFKKICPALTPANLLDWNFLFSVFIGPYIDQLSVNYAYEREEKKATIIQTIRWIYKKFAGFWNKMPNNMVDVFIPIKIEARINNNLKRIKEKVFKLKEYNFKRLHIEDINHLEVKNWNKRLIKILQNNPNFDYNKVNNYGKKWVTKPGWF